MLAYIVLDIETGFADKDTVMRAAEGWAPPANVKDPEKVAERRSAAYAAIVEKSALLDGSPITCVALVCGATGARKVFTSEGRGGEKGMLHDVRAFLDEQTGPDTVLVGHNLCGFDLPRLRVAYLRNRLALPQILRVDVDEAKRPRVFDTMRQFHYFTSERHEDRHISLRDVVAAFGLPALKDGVSGKDMPRLADEGKWDIIREYCLLDAVATEAAFLMMNSAHKDQK